VLLFAGDVLGLALHLVSGGHPAFNLDSEGNVPTWYSSAKLLGIAALSVAAYRAERKNPAPYPWLWLLMAGLFGLMSMDETASLHERAAGELVKLGFAGNLRANLLGGDEAKDSFAWVVLFSPVAAAVVFFLAAFAWTRRALLRRVLKLGAAGLACYLGALALEPAAVYFTPAIANWDKATQQRYQRFSTVEEMLELVGTSLLLLTVLACARAPRRDGAVSST
jgi:hypothetical protein